MNNRLFSSLAFPLFVFFAALAAVPLSAAVPPSLQAGHLRCEYKTDPSAIDAPHPRLSWQLQSNVRGQAQSAYQVLVATRPQLPAAGRGDLWNSGIVASAESVGIEYRGRPLTSGQKCWWTVRVWDKSGRPAPGGASGFWQMGLLKPSDWTASWIAAPTPRLVHVGTRILPPCPYLRRTFTLTKPVKSATIYVTAHGLYELHLNGAKVGDAVLTPGWTDYNKRLDYQAYDVTAALHPGANTVGAILGDGWYCGYLGFNSQRDLYGSVPALRMQMEVTYADGTRQTVASDQNWQGRTGPIVYSDLLQGEAYDARAELPGWDRPGSADAGWLPVVPAVSGLPSGRSELVSVTAVLRARVRDNALSVVAGNDLAGDPAFGTPKSLRVAYTLNGQAHTRTVNEGETLTLPGLGEAPGPLVIREAMYGASAAPIPAGLVGTVGPPVRVTQYLPARTIAQPAPGVSIFDLGQNMVGWARLAVRGAAGTTVTLRFGEVLNPDGTLYTANLRTARATDTYILKGGGPEVFEPRFTLHGFRYVEVTGYPGPPSLGAVTGCVVGSDTPPAGTFTCSSPLVNQLQRNIVWGQRGNFVSVPTDCPQRDERLGWMGDAQVFARTATCNRDTAAFYESWMDTVEDSQSAEGGFSDVSPRIVDRGDGAPAWGDAGVIVPWTVYLAYGDTEIVRRHWAAMTRWLGYIGAANPDGLWHNRHNGDYGDWLANGDNTPHDVLATAYYAYDAHLTAQMARVIGRPREAAQYDALFERIKGAFGKAYVSADGHIAGDTQTGYVLALRFGLLPEGLRGAAGSYLAANIASKNNHLSTGFVGVGFLCPVLTASGHNDAAYTLLQNTTFPSWGYSIMQGATTIWERWDGYTKDKGFQSPSMNSFNHYSLGSVGQWLYQDVAGIDTDPAAPGYKHIWLHPHPGPGLTSAQAEYASIRGPIRSAWKIKNGKIAGGRFVWDVSIPANTTATAWVPAQSAAGVTESGRPLSRAPGVKVSASERGAVVCELASGTYHFAAALPGPGGVLSSNAK